MQAVGCAITQDNIVGWYPNKASKQLLHSVWNCYVSRKLLSSITHVASEFAVQTRHSCLHDTISLLLVTDPVLRVVLGSRTNS